MANVCSNRAVIRHKDPAQLNRLMGAWDRGAVCEEFLPVPPSVGDKRGWRICTWGTSLDFGEGNCVEPSVRTNDGLRIAFHTKSTPPLGLYLELLHQGFEVEALYWEPGNGFCGFVEGALVRDFEIRSRDISEIRKHVDAELIEVFAMEEYYADEEDEDDLDDSPREPWEAQFDLAHSVAEKAKSYSAAIALLKALKKNSQA